MNKFSCTFLVFVFFISISSVCNSQGICFSSSGASNAPSAIIDVVCNDQGVLFPRMTETQRDAIKSPAEGLVLYNLTSNTFNFFNGTNWIEVQSTFVSATSGAVSPGNGIAINNTGAQPHNSAKLDIASTSKGVLLPRTTTTSVSSPDDGLILYNTSAKKLSFYNGASWDSPCSLSVPGSSATGSSGVDGLAINTNGDVADQSAILDISSADRGMLLPRLTNAERNDLLPVAGLLVYNTDTELPEYWNGSGWYSLGSTSGDGFITRWRTTTINESITLPLSNGNSSSFNCTVYWGDGNQSTITAYDDPDRIHIYAAAGDYDVEIVGTCEGWSFNDGGDKLKVIAIVDWGNSCGFDGFKYLEYGFMGCSNLASLATGSIPASGTGCICFIRAFQASSITSIPVGLFDNHPLVSVNGFHSTFAFCYSLSSIPAGLFDNNTLVSTSGFAGTFYTCTSLTSIPAGLFDQNTLVSTDGFFNTFCYCSNITTVPEELFRFNTLVTGNGFYQTFYGCNSLQLNRNIFFADGEAGTRFLNKSVSFYGCFQRFLFSGVMGEAPPLWSCDFGTGTVTSTRCYNGAGNSTSSLSNYSSIPAPWK